MPDVLRTCKDKFSIVSVFKKHVVQETDMKTGRKYSFL